MRIAKALLYVSIIAVSPAFPAEAPAKSLTCTTGPLSKALGGTTWLVYACSDGKSLAIVSDPASPASPFVFFLAAKGATYTITGEGNGKKSATKPAFDALTQMTPTEIVGLHSDVLSAAHADAAKQPPPNPSLERP